jgi:hypothetical protein
MPYFSNKIIARRLAPIRPRGMTRKGAGGSLIFSQSRQLNSRARSASRAGYGAIWHGQKSWNGVAILARGADPTETRRGLPGDPDDTHSRYIEAAVSGLLIGCLYLPNGNPAPGQSSITSSPGSNGWPSTGRSCVTFAARPASPFARSVSAAMSWPKRSSLSASGSSSKRPNGPRRANRAPSCTFADG